MRLTAFIPARLESKRFPNKVIKHIFGLPMIEHVRRRALLSKIFDKVYVVTNSLKIKKIIENFKGDVIISKKKHHNGSSRVSEISSKFKFDFAFVLFGDEPFLDPESIKKCKKYLKKYPAEVYNVVTNLSIGDNRSKHIVKTIISSNKIINYLRKINNINSKCKLYKSTGVLIFKKNLLKKYKLLTIKKRETREKIEQLRFLDNNVTVKPIYLKNIYPSINTQKEFKHLVKKIKSSRKELKLMKKIKNFYLK